MNENADILLEKPKKRVNVEQTAKVTPVTSSVKPAPTISENVSSQSAPSSSHLPQNSNLMMLVQIMTVIQTAQKVH